MLDPEVIFLNHGSFGSCPVPVFAEYQRWQHELERRPVEFMVRRLEALLREQREALAGFVRASVEDLAFVTNVTMAVNAVAHGISLGPGDEVVGTTHEYGACERAWRYYADRRGFTYRAVEPEALWDSLSPRTRMLFFSHITSPTARLFPVEEWCSQARTRGLLTMVDGAHAPGQLELDLRALGADFYTGNLHKWLNTPKGCAFLYVREELQRRLQPLVVGWGWEPELGFSAWHEQQGTREPSAFLCVSAAIDFHREHITPVARAACRHLARYFVEQLGGGCVDTQLGAAALPAGTDVDHVKAHLYDRYRVEIPVYRWNGHAMTRVSVQIYNSLEEVDYALGAIKATVRNSDPSPGSCAG